MPKDPAAAATVRKKRPSIASASDDAPQPAKRPQQQRRGGRNHDDDNHPQLSTASPLFPLPVRAADCGPDLPTPNADTRKRLEAAYGGLTFPDELMQVFDFCKMECSRETCDKNGSMAQAEAPPAEAFRLSLAPLGLQPCGPFDFLLCFGAPLPTGFDWLLHCRFAQDPPEFLTLFAGLGADQGWETHIGYVRDSPELAPAFLALNDASVNGEFARLGEGICQSLFQFAKRRKPSLSVAQLRSQDQLLSRLVAFCRRRRSRGSDDDDADVQGADAAPSPALKRRDKTSVVARTLNGLGLCVPVSAEDGVGYRELPHRDADLRRMLGRIAARCDALGDADKDSQARLVLLEPVDEMVTLVQFANDEGDPGMGLELGLDLLSVPSATGCYDDVIVGLLDTGYGLVGRRLYGDIVRRHLPVRRRYRKSVV